MTLFSKINLNNIPTTIILLVIFLLGISVYANSLTNDFVWDDEVLIQGNSSLINTKNIIDFFSKPIHNQFLGYYRPLQMVSFKFDSLIWGLKEPFGYHLTSILLHILNAIMVYILLYTLLQNKLTSTLCSLLFLTHPALSECVNFISSRSNLIVLFFLLLSLIFYVKNDKNRNIIFYLISISSYIFSLFSNEIAIIFPFFLIFYELINKKSLKNTSFYFLILLIFIIFRSQIIPLTLYKKQISHISTFFTTPKIIFNYLKIMLIPINLHKLWQISPTHSISSPGFFLYSLFIIAIVMMCKYLIKKNSHILLGIIWFILMLLPVSQVKSHDYASPLISEGWLYVPAIGMLIFLAHCFSKGIRSLSKLTKISFIYLFCFIFSVYVSLTIRQNTIWNSSVSLLENIIQYDNKQPYTLFVLGKAYFKIGDYSNSLSTYNNAILEYKKINNISITRERLLEIYNTMSIIYLKLNEFGNAISVLKEALKINPDNSRSQYYLAISYLMQNKISSAIHECKKSIEIENKSEYLNLLNMLYAIENYMKSNKPFTINLKIIISS